MTSLRTKVGLQLDHALCVARHFAAAIGNSCCRVEIAGSIRRRQPRVGDIEIIAIPTYARNLLGEDGDSQLERRLSHLIKYRSLYRGRCDGPKYKQLELPAGMGDRVPLDLFIVHEESWGVQLAIRTGPADFSRLLVTSRRDRGLLPDIYKVAKGRVWEALDNEALVSRHLDRGSWSHLPTPEEGDFLRLCNAEIRPEDREQWRRHLVCS